MRAAVCRVYGPPEGVRVEDIPSPGMDAGDARVAVECAAVNFPDVLIVADDYQLSAPTPFVVGSEFAGVVSAVAPDATAVAVGDRVFGSVFVGAFAEEVVAPAASLTVVPPGVSLRDAAGFGVAHRTSYNVLRSVAALQPGEELVVLGAGGGVGLAAVQLGAVLGATVTAVASSAEKLAAAASEGATRLVNHRTDGLRRALERALPEGADVVVDPVGGDLSEPALRSLRWGGRFVTVGFASGAIPSVPLNLVLLKGVQVLGYQSGAFRVHLPEQAHRNLQELIELLADGRVHAHVGATFTLDDAPAALRLVADGQAVGKVIVAVR